MRQTFAQLFNENPCSGWGVDAREFSGRRSTRSRDKSIVARQERIIALGAGKVAAMLDELERSLLPVPKLAPEEVVDAASTRLRDAFVADLGNAAMTAHLSATSAVLLGGAIEIVRARSAGQRTKPPFMRMVADAEAFVRARIWLTEDMVAQIKAAYTEHALDLAHVVITPHARDCLDAAVARIIGEKLRVAAGKKLIAETLKALGLSRRNPHAVESLLRMHVQHAYTAASTTASQLVSRWKECPSACPDGTQPTATRSGDHVSLLDEFAKVAMMIVANEWDGASRDAVCLTLGVKPEDYIPAVHWPMLLARDSYSYAAAMVAEKRRREGGGA